MPCDDSGSKPSAASPTASQPSPEAGDRVLLWAAQKPPLPSPCPSGSKPQARNESDSTEQPDNRRRSDAVSRASAAAGRSASVWKATTRRPAGSGALYHQPSGSASIQVRPDCRPGVSRPWAQPQTSRSDTARRAPKRLASGEPRPPASTSRRAWTGRRRPAVSTSSSQPSPALSTDSVWAGISRAAPREAATRRSQPSNRPRSRCQPGPSRSCRLSASTGSGPPHTDRPPWLG